MKVKKSHLSVAVVGVLVAALIAGGIFLYAKGGQGTGQDKPQESGSSQVVEDQQATIESQYDYYGVINGVEGHSGSGEFGYSLKDANFVMLAKLNNLEELQGNNFYEGWLVNPTDKKFISTGKLNNVSGNWTNTFSADVDYTSYTKYIVTLEPDDGDPAPAAHVAEGIAASKIAEDQPAATSKNRSGYLSLSDYQADTAAFGDSKVVLFFNASWCPTCKVLDSSLKSQADQFPDDLAVINVDYDKETDLKAKYGVRAQHTLVQIDASGNQIAKWSGGGDLESITQELK